VGFFLNLFRAARNVSGDNATARMTQSTDRIAEQVLVLRCQAGDEAAFADLVVRYHRRVHYYLQKMLNSADRADDATQDLWMDVFRSIPKLRDATSFAAWLYRLARDRAYRELRKSKPLSKSLDEVDPSDKMDEDEFSADDAAAVHAGLDRLAPEHREVLMLRFVESMSYQQVAVVVGCELGTVRSRIHYAKRALRRLLERNKHEQRIRVTTH
jgi:RNA polymerase sigma-70 factor (ECF subfamily)